MVKGYAYTYNSATGTLAATNPIRYRGYYYDTETGLYYLQSRDTTTPPSADSTTRIKTLLLLVPGTIICILWRISISNYKQLNTEKFRIIFRIEEELTIHPFKEEWTFLKINKKYRDGTSLESFLPFLFILLYLIATVLILVEG